MKVFALIAAASALTACVMQAGDYDAAPLTPSQETAVKSAVAYRLRDAESARWRGLMTVTRPNGQSYVCGQVNSTNGFGGFTGFMPFWGRWQPDGSFRPEQIATPDQAPYFGAVCPR